MGEMSFVQQLERQTPLLYSRIDPVSVALWRDRWLEASSVVSPELAATTRRLASEPCFAALSSCIFSSSPYISTLWTRSPEFIANLLEGDIEDLVVTRISAIAVAGGEADESVLMRKMRIAKNEMALAVALADISGLWTLQQVTGALSDFADASLQAASDHLLGVRIGDHDLTAREAARRGLIIIGMGKHGARELNYSSDIDFIVLFDPNRVDERLVRSCKSLTLQEVYVRMARGLVRLLQERTADGYVFRTDLRLRPDPSSTPLALSVEAAEFYYGSLGQNWERAAMIKARIVAGDKEAGELFLRQLWPFQWRRHLDFAAINDIHSIKRQIYTEKGGAKIAIAGHDLKLGRGGIREIEFYAQTLQLIWGGRDSSLRVPGTCEALDALAAAGRLPHAIAEDLKNAYRTLRRVEHRLQMIEDEQTHRLPVDAAQAERLAGFLGYEDFTTFSVDLRKVLETVENHYARLFEEAPSLTGPRQIGGNLVFTGVEDDPETLTTLTQLGYDDPSMVAASVRAWHYGRIRATRSARARQLLTELIPAILDTLGTTPSPDLTFRRFERFLAVLPSGVQFFSLLHARPDLLEIVALIMGTSPQLADYLAYYPLSLDAMLSEPMAPVLPNRTEFAEEIAELLTKANDFQDVLDIVRRFVSDRRFQVMVRFLKADNDAAAVGYCLSDLAEVAVTTLLAAVEKSFMQLHGQIEGGRFAVVAMGKLGARELTISSDLDLVFLYDVEGDNAEGGQRLSLGGEKSLPKSLYYQRLGQRLIAALTAPTAAGELYSVDMRLRPSGNKGPVAVSFASFTVYQAKEAWTWEHMALTKARPIAGDLAFQQEVNAAISAVLAIQRDPVAIVCDVFDMRNRMRREFPTSGPFDIKNIPGGLTDLEFVIQYLLLVNGCHGRIRREILEDIADLGTSGVLDKATADGLVAADLFLRGLQMLFRLLGVRPGENCWCSMLEPVVARVMGLADFESVKREVASSIELVSHLFDMWIAVPASRSESERKK